MSLCKIANLLFADECVLPISASDLKYRLITNKLLISSARVSIRIRSNPVFWLDPACYQISLNGFGSGFQISLDPDPDPVCPERLDPDPVNIRPDPKP